MTDSRTERGEPLVIAGRYEVQVEIGSGAFATTWRGLDRRLGRLVAIKILHTQFAHDPAYVLRFEREAQAAASVSHGNVVDIYDFGRQDDLLYIVMQYIAGEDLKHLIVRERVLPPERAREIVLQVLAGLGAIHAAGIVHRDIKPQNVLVGNDGQIRVADFGIAQIEDRSDLTTAGTAFGTAAYMAPEQADGRDVGPWTDLYAVGVVLYELLTGTLPFTAPTAMAMMLAHMQETPEPPSMRATRWPISGDLDAVTMQALQKQPRDRFRSTAAMGQALRNASVHGAWPAATPAAATSTATRPITRPTPYVRPAAQPPARPSAGPSMASGEGRGLSAVMRGFLALLLVAAAVGAFYLWQVTQGDDGDTPGSGPTPTAPVTATVPATSEDLIVPPPEPTPTATLPEIEEEPTATLESLPTETPVPTPTEEAPTIEPIGPDTGTQGADDGASQGGIIEPMPTPTVP
ncbi:MAG: serine/threonine-protein kinase [Thermomicrobiales bacterium]